MSSRLVDLHIDDDLDDTSTESEEDSTLLDTELISAARSGDVERIGELLALSTCNSDALFVDESASVDGTTMNTAIRC